MTRPILYSFRRCPYAMRARLAIQSAGIQCELREIVLRDKAAAFLEASPKGTVPVVLVDGDVIEESLDVMKWALSQNDPEGWQDMPDVGHDWIARCDGPFKHDLDRTKYANRYPDADPTKSRNGAAAFLRDLNDAIGEKAWLFGNAPSWADFAILPFVRQFANIDRTWFDDQDWPNVARWLNAFLESDRFQTIMSKYSKWEPGDPVTLFP